MYSAERHALVELVAEYMMLQPEGAVGGVPEREQPDLDELEVENVWQQEVAVGNVCETLDPKTVDPAEFRRKELQLRERELQLEMPRKVHIPLTLKVTL